MMLCIVSANVSALFGLFGIYLLKNKCIYSHGCKKPTGRTGSYYGHKDECEKDEQEAVSWLMTIRVRYMTASFQADVTHHKVCVCVLYSLYLIG